MKRSYHILLLFAALSLNVQAQALNENDMAIDRLKSLEEIMMMVLNNAPGLEVLNTSQEQTKQEIALTRKKWLRHISLTAGVNYGNGVISDQLRNNSGIDNVAYLTRQNVTYNVGLNLRLPFTEISSRKNEIKVKQLEIKRLEYQKKDQSQLIRHEVIRRYNALKSCLKSLELMAEVVEANDIALKLAENYFKAGKLPMEQYRMAIDQRYSSVLELEKTRNEAWYCFKSLQEMAGTSILK